MSELAKKSCVPCRGGVPPLSGDELQKFAKQVEGWQVINGHHLHKLIPFPDFRAALAFTNRVGDLAEEQGHHPDILLSWGKTEITIWTHKIDGLTESDFILAAQTRAAPDVTATRRVGRAKYGFGVNIEQEICSDVGVFARLGWNDGKTEDFAFTAIDRLASGGVSVKGTRWNRKEDVAATSFTASGISGVHALYLERGGLDFLIGDGRLNYGPEYLWESYYSARLLPGVFASFDLQRVDNPAFNRDRGPAWIESLRLHVEFGVKPRGAK